MANQEHLDILKQGIEVWNKRREENSLDPYFARGPNLREADLNKAKLRGANLSLARLNKASLVEADLSWVDLRRASLIEADLRAANLSRANLVQARLSRANLSGANLDGTDFHAAWLGDADLSGARLHHANLSGAILNNTDFTQARIYHTTFGDVDLSVVKGLETVNVKHGGPSTIGIDTIINSQGKIPEIFLRRAGVPDSIIEQIPALVGSLKPIDFYSCFISYSSKDQDFAERLHADLQAQGVRVWFAPHDLRPGAVFLRGIEEAIRVYDKLLLILSEHSVKSQWVEYEVDTALHKELSRNQLVLFPIRLDNTVLESTAGWAVRLHPRHIGDFTCWKDHDAYQKAFTRLLRDLKAEAQKEMPREDLS